jgi:hypothetical protein
VKNLSKQTENLLEVFWLPFIGFKYIKSWSHFRQAFPNSAFTHSSHGTWLFVFDSLRFFDGGDPGWK